MAHIERKDSQINTTLDEVEQRSNRLKIQYEKYFSGIERIEPLKEREDIKRVLRDLGDKQMPNATQRFRYQQLKARFQSLELYWMRNLAMIERGTHPKMKFRADLKDVSRMKKSTDNALPEADVEPLMSAEQEEVLRRRQEIQEREERALKMVYDKYMEARAKCGQSTDLAFDTVRNILKQQVRQIKSQYNVETVRFRINIEDGKAKVKAVPITAEPPKTS
jgi:hypothetical protein